jgi:hypothetical protein
MERVPKVSERLKLVEIKCKNVGLRVCEIISFLSRFMQVNIMLVTRDSHCELTSYTLQSLNMLVSVHSISGPIQSM